VTERFNAAVQMPLVSLTTARSQVVMRAYSCNGKRLGASIVRDEGSVAEILDLVFPELISKPVSNRRSFPGDCQTSHS
jgi:hypothetical protein